MPHQQAATDTGALLPAFADPVRDASRTFRTIMEATAHPALAYELPVNVPAISRFMPGTLAILLTLADAETAVCVTDHDPKLLSDYLRFHCGCPLVTEPQRAIFGVIGAQVNAERAFSFPVGVDQYPDRAATVIIQVKDFETGNARSFRGPGIKDTRVFRPSLSDGFWKLWRRNMALYPQGIDVLLVNDRRIAALPRSTRLEA